MARRVGLAIFHGMTIRPALLAAALLVLPLSAPAIERAGRGDASGSIKRAEQLLADDKPEEAAAAYTEAAEAAPRDWHAFSGRALAYDRLQLADLANADRDHAVQVAPDAFEPLMDRGTKLFLKKRYADAIRDLDAAVRLKPGYFALYHWRGCAYAQNNQPEQAVADFTRVIDAGADASDYQGVELFNRALAEHALGRLPDALADYEAAEKAGQSTVDARAECLIDLRRWKDAEEIYSDILRATDEDSDEDRKARYDALRNRAVALAGQKLHERAEADLTEAIALKPDDLYAYGTASWTRLFAGKFAEARTAALKALSIDGSQTWVHLNLAHAYVLEGHLDWAKSIYVQDKDKRGSWNRSGVEIALQDLKDLREAGVEHPDLARAEEFLHTLATP